MPTQRLGNLALPAPEIDTFSAAHPAREIDFINATSKDNIKLGLPTLKISSRTYIAAYKKLSRPRETLSKLALPAPKVVAVSAAHPTGEIDYITSKDTIPLGDEGTSDGIVTDSEVVSPDCTSSVDQQYVQAEICSKKNKESKFIVQIKAGRKRGLHIIYCKSKILVTYTDVESFLSNRQWKDVFLQISSQAITEIQVG